MELLFIKRKFKLKMTQEQMCKRLGVSITTIKNWEGSKVSPKLYQLQKIIDGYELTIEELLKLIKEENLREGNDK